MRSRLVRCAAVSLLLAACTAPVSVHRADVADVYRSVTAYALDDGRPSADTRVTLTRAGLDEAYAEDPVGAIRTLHAMALQGDRRSRLYALSECCYLAGDLFRDRSLFLASAIYADLFLLGGGPEAAPGPFRQRFRRACDLYNVSLARAFSAEDGGAFVPEAGRVELPVGAVTVESPALPLSFGELAFDQLIPSITIGVTGFRARAVRSGLGAPLVARRSEAATASAERRAHLAPRSAIAVTAFLRVSGELEDMAEANLTATLEFHRPADVREVRVNGHEVPIEFDVTAPLAWELSETKPWEHEVEYFFGVGDDAEVNEVLLTEPYEPGRLPVVFIHGTASSASRWAEVLNELHDDALVAGRCQFWTYRYPSGAPILASAAGLRRGLARVVRDLDPEGKDEALRRMVVVGHSQGGLIARLLVTTSGGRFWGALSQTPFDALDLGDAERRIMQPVFFFDPSPYVARTVFVATPHRGSYVAGNWIASLVGGFVSLPKYVVRGAGRLAASALGKGAELDLTSFSTAVADMSPASPFLEALAASPTAPDLPLHSIIAVDGEGPLAEGDDGVVAYSSAHIDGVASELIVPCDHSCQSHPMVVAEIRRILHEHLRNLAP